ncbi:histidine phosphatase family protein [Candidatus Nomurabacteria bacterium]|nr:histidine phosphatase family protein [Candidatus Nomurabacteria bacterium]
MKQIIFLRPAPYSDRINEKDLISGFDLIGLQKHDPEILVKDTETQNKIKMIFKKFKPVKIYSSPASRCTQTAELFNTYFEVSPFLNEIKFSLTGSLDAKFINKKEPDVNKLRIELVKAFVKNKTIEKPEEVILRINSFMQMIKNMDGNVVCISHAFIMKFYEIFFKKNGEITSSVLFLKSYDWTIKPYDFLGGFIVTVENHDMIPKVEIF